MDVNRPLTPDEQATLMDRADGLSKRVEELDEENAALRDTIEAIKAYIVESVVAVVNDVDAYMPELDAENPEIKRQSVRRVAGSVCELYATISTRLSAARLTKRYATRVGHPCI